MTIVASVLAILQAAAPVEVLPVDAQMAIYEAAFPGLAGDIAKGNADRDRLGPAEAGWSTSGLSVASAIAARQGNPDQHVLGEWTRSVHSVTVPGDRPFPLPSNFRRYTVRDHGGPVDYHYYHRLAPGVVIHFFGAPRWVDNAQCGRTQGIELISNRAWQDWSEEAALIAFSVARTARDDPRNSCTIYRPTGDGRFRELLFSPEGRPLLFLATEPPEIVSVTSRVEATARIFDSSEPQPLSD